jgi:NADPH-dependent glutamate synthase beta subunit-like oxidoreductase
VVDRHDSPGGSLRLVSEEQLPAMVLARETALLGDAGVEFKLGVELGDQVTIDGLSRGFEAILLATGETGAGEAGKLGVAMAGTAIKTDPNTCQTPLPKVFATGAAVKAVKQLVRALAEAARPRNVFIASSQTSRCGGPKRPFPVSWAGSTRASCGSSWRLPTAAAV